MGSSKTRMTWRKRKMTKEQEEQTYLTLGFVSEHREDVEVFAISELSCPLSHSTSLSPLACLLFNIDLLLLIDLLSLTEHLVIVVRGEGEGEEEGEGIYII